MIESTGAYNNNGRLYYLGTFCKEALYYVLNILPYSVLTGTLRDSRFVPVFSDKESES